MWGWIISRLIQLHLVQTRGPFNRLKGKHCPPCNMIYTEMLQRLPGHPDYSYPARHSWWSSQSRIGSVWRKAEPHIIARHLSSLIAQGHKPPRLPFKCTWSFTPKLSVMMNLNGLAGKMLEKALSLMTPMKDPDLQLWGAAPAYAVERAQVQCAHVS